MKRTECHVVAALVLPCLLLAACARMTSRQPNDSSRSAPCDAYSISLKNDMERPIDFEIEIDSVPLLRARVDASQKMEMRMEPFRRARPSGNLRFRVECPTGDGGLDVYEDTVAVKSVQATAFRAFRDEKTGRCLVSAVFEDRLVTWMDEAPSEE